MNDLLAYAKHHKRQYLIDEFSPNNLLSTKEVTYGSDKKQLWICQFCKSEYDMEISKRTIQNRNCPYCSGMRVNHTNSLWSTHPNIAKLLTDPKDGHIVTAGSTKKRDFTCPTCKTINKRKIIQNVVYQGLSCSHCSDGLRYPEKFVSNMLRQIDLEFETQKVFTWSKNIQHDNSKIRGKKKYDFYIPDLKCIIETHGLQHYNGGYQSLGGKSQQEEQLNDELKRELALANGINNYIVINCSISNFELIRINIMNSGLSAIFNLNNIDWMKCHEFACGSLIKPVCDLWNNRSTNKSLGLIAKHLNVSSKTVSVYLKKGSLLGWCDYDPKNIMIRSVVRLSLTNEFIDQFERMSDASNSLGISIAHISSVCSNKRKTAGGFKWMYKEDYDNRVH